MAEDITLALRIKAELEDALSALEQLTAGVEDVGTSASDAERETRDLTRETDHLTASQQAAARAAEAGVSAYRELRSAVLAYVSLQGAVAAVLRADDFRVLQQRVERLDGSFAALYATAQSVNVPVATTVELFQRLGMTRQTIGATTAQVETVSAAVFQLGRIGASSQEQIESAAAQLGQAFSSTQAQWEDFGIIADSMPELLRRIEAGLGLMPGTIKQAVAQGLDMRDVFDAILKQAPQIAQEFEQIPENIRGASVRLSNAADAFISRLDQALGLSKNLAEWLEKGANYLDAMAASQQLGADPGQSPIERLGAIITSRSNRTNQLRQAQADLADYNAPSAGAMLGLSADELAEQIRIAAETVASLQASVDILAKAEDAARAQVLGAAGSVGAGAQALSAVGDAWAESMTRATAQTLGWSSGVDAAGARLAKTASTVRESAKAFGIPEEVVLSVYAMENAFGRVETSSAGARGAMQFMPATAEAVARQMNAAGAATGMTAEAISTDLVAGIKAGAFHLADLQGQFGEFYKTLIAYNAGPGKVDLPFAKLPAETQAYVRNGIKLIEEYAQATGRAGDYANELAAANDYMAGRTKEAGTATSKLSAEQRAAQRAAADYASAQLAAADALRDGEAGVGDYLQGLRDQIDLSQLSTAEQAAMRAEIELTDRARTAELRAIQAAASGNTQLSDALLQVAAGYRAAIPEAQQLAVELDNAGRATDALGRDMRTMEDLVTDAAKSAADAIQSELGDAFEDLFRGSLDSADDFVDALGDILIRGISQIAAQIVSQRIVVPIIASVAGQGSAAGGYAQQMLGGQSGGGMDSLYGFAGQGAKSWLSDAGTSFGNWATGNGWNTYSLSAGSAVTNGVYSLGSSGNVAMIDGFAYNMPSSSTGTMARAGTNWGGMAQGAANLGGGLVGGYVGGGLASNWFGDSQEVSMGSSLGSMAGGYFGTAAGTAIATSGAMSGAAMGAAYGSVVPVIGTAIGAIVGAIGGGALGSLFGGKEKKPAIPYSNATVNYKGELEATAFNSDGAAQADINSATQAINVSLQQLEEALGGTAYGVTQARHAFKGVSDTDMSGDNLNDWMSGTASDIAAAMIDAFEIGVQAEGDGVGKAFGLLVREGLQAAGDDPQLLLATIDSANAIYSQLGGAVASLFAVGLGDALRLDSGNMTHSIDMLGGYANAIRSEGQTFVDALNDVGNAVVAVVALDSVLDLSNLAGEQLVRFGDYVVSATSSLDALAVGAQTYVQEFLTAEQQQARAVELARANIESVIGSNNIWLADASRSDYMAALSDGIDLSTEGGARLAAQLIELAPQFDTVYDAMEAASGATEDLVETTEDLAEIARERRALEIDLMAAQGDSAGALVASREDELASLHESNRAIQEQIWALNDQAEATAAAAQAAEEAAQVQAAIAAEYRGLEIALMAAQGDAAGALAATREDELAALHSSNRAIQSQIWALNDQAEAAAAAAQVAEEAAQAQAAIASEYRRLEIALMTAQGNDAGALAAKRADELAALDASNRAIQRQIWALNDQAEAAAAAAQAAEEAAQAQAAIASEYRRLEIELMTAQGNDAGALAATRADELAALDASNRAIQQRIWILQDEAEFAQRIDDYVAQYLPETVAISELAAAQDELAEAVGRQLLTQQQADSIWANMLVGMERFTDASSSARSALLDWSESTRQEIFGADLGAAQASYSTQLAMARAGDLDAIASLTDYARNYISSARDNSNSRGDYLRTAARVTGQVEGVGQSPATTTDLLNAINELKQAIADQAGDDDDAFAQVIEWSRDTAQTLMRWDRDGIPAETT